MVTLTQAKPPIYVPQADDLDKIFQVPAMVADGAVNWEQVAERFRVGPRTAWYYVAAAEALGLVEKDAKGADLRATPRWWMVKDDPRARRRVVLDSAIMQFIAKSMGCEIPLSDPPPVELDNVYAIRDALKSLGFSPRSALRRAYTLRAWIRSLRR